MYHTRTVESDRRTLLSQCASPRWRYPKSGGLVIGRNLRVNHPTASVTVPGSDLPFYGMDPSDPVTYVRPYNPVPGMVARLNFDGARPAPAGGVQRGRQPRLWWPGGVAGSSVRNG